MANMAMIRIKFAEILSEKSGIQNNERIPGNGREDQNPGLLDFHGAREGGEERMKP